MDLYGKWPAQLTGLWDYLIKYLVCCYAININTTSLFDLIT